MGFKESIGRKFLEEIIETANEVLPEAEVKEIEKPEEPIKTEVKEVLPKKEILSTITKNNIPKAKKKVVKKQREDTKVVIDCGIKGNTIEVRDFRAIVKKKGLQINVVLNGIIAEWNHNNYNL